MEAMTLKPRPDSRLDSEHETKFGVVRNSLKPAISEAVFDAGHVVLHDESFGTRNEFSPSVVTRHYFKGVARWELTASAGSHDLEALINEPLDLIMEDPSILAVSDVTDCFSIVVGLASTRTGGLDLTLHKTAALVTPAARWPCIV